MSAEPAAVSLIVSSSPHAHSGASVRRIMLDVIIALVPALAVGLYLFGWNALRLVVVCVSACVLIEALCRKAMGRDPGVGDLSAVVTGVLLAFNLPPALPGWMAVIGCVFAIAVAKQIFGGLGYNPFNPALVGRAMLLVSFPVHMTTWAVPARLASVLEPARTAVDAVTMATPLGWAKTSLSAGNALPLALDSVATAWEFFAGFKPGCIGETSGLALLIGAAYLLYRRCIGWQTPVFFVGAVAVFAAILWRVDPARNLHPVFHVLTGGVMIGAFFMATDMVTSPVTRAGMAVFGAGCGVITMLIRAWGGYPEGVSFAILLMNAVTPLINKATRPRVFGHGRRK
ncbi:MAG: RnfABCDGE type electron transport complex subunit D [Lentisphaerae bacterium]|nr:RnfABCDGE type electron transport complex subunit D [Lentisphaerota bacterium]